MAKQSEKDIINKVLTKPSTSDAISRMIEDQTESFPSASDVTVSSTYIDPFEFPEWCNQEKFAFAWIDPKDDIQRHRAMDKGYFKIVTRTSSCIVGKYKERDFRDHGAVERQGMILVFRPKDLDERLRTGPVLAHADMVSTMEAGKQSEGYDLTQAKFKQGDRSQAERENKGSIDVVAYEEAGEEGIKQVLPS